MKKGEIKKDFLQSEIWRKFQESVSLGRRTFCVSLENFYASIIEHKLPIVGRYFYVPKGPIFLENKKQEAEEGLLKLIDLAKKERIGWIRFDANDERVLDIIRKIVRKKVVKAPHDMQPRELFIINITKSEEELFSEMKSKTRYGIRVAKKRGLKTFQINNVAAKEKNKYIERFIELVKITAKRNGIVSHSENYYRKC